MLFLHELLKDWPCSFIGQQINRPIAGVTEHSGRVKPGDLFIARKGQKVDGLTFIEEAIRLGAAAIVMDREPTVATALALPIIIVPNCQTFLSYASARLAGNPSERLHITAVTGTNGKTTVTHFISQLLQAAHYKVAVIGTLGLFIDGESIDYELPKMTTLPAEYLHPLLGRCEAEGVTHIVMEASSLGLSTDRLTDCEIDVGLLLNVSEDHYDEHGSKEAYIQAKQKIVEMAKMLIVNGDDPTCVEMTAMKKEQVIYFGKSTGVQFHLLEHKDGSVIRTPTGTYAIDFPVIEDFNRMNIIAAISTLAMLAHSFAQIKSVAERLVLPEGRMQKTERDGVTVIIDYAHTPDALKLVLQTIGEQASGNIITVFGCGGNRDKGKRKKMGEVAGQYAKKVIITSDNPRDEDPFHIIEEIKEGVQLKATSYHIEVDRAMAIEHAISMANRGDIVLVAGKGHEKTQEIGRQILAFSDQEIVDKFLFKR